MPLYHLLKRDDGQEADVGTLRLTNPWTVECWMCRKELVLGDPVYVATPRNGHLFSNQVVVHARHADGDSYAS
jgi:hypothetical protein